MAATSLLARLGLRVATLGSAASLAIAAPIAEGDVSQAAHTHAARTGWFFPTATSIGVVTNAAERLRVYADGSVQIGGAYGASPATPLVVSMGAGQYVAAKFVCTANDYCSVYVTSQGGKSSLYLADTSSGYSAIVSHGVIAGASSHALQFNMTGNIDATPQMALYGDGALQIGGASFTASPGASILTVNGSIGVGAITTPTAPISVYTSAAGNATCIDFTTSVGGLGGQLYAVNLAANSGIGFNFPGASSGANNWFFLRFNSSTDKLYTGAYIPTGTTHSIANQTPCSNWYLGLQANLPFTTLPRPHFVVDTTPNNAAVYGNARVGINAGFIPVGTLDVIAESETNGGAPVIVATHGILDLGYAIAAFDGATLGYFSGSASGTYVAINSSSSFVGNFLDCQLFGVSKFRVGYDGALTTVSLLTMGAGENHAITSVNTNTALDATHYTVLVDASGGAVTVNLPDSTATTNINGRVYNVKKIDASANTVTVQRTGVTDQIDGASTSIISAQYQSRTYQCRTASAAANRWNVI